MAITPAEAEVPHAVFTRPGIPPGQARGRSIMMAVITTIPPSRVFPAIMLVLNVCAAGGYALGGDWRQCIYWLAAATCLVCITYPASDG
jgi:hypothetical protein